MIIRTPAWFFIGMLTGTIITLAFVVAFIKAGRK